MYLNLVQVAESFGVSEKVVEGWVRDEGLPHTLDRGRPLFDQAQVVQWAAERGLAAHVGHLAPEAPVLSGEIALGRLARAGGVWRDVAAADLTEVLVRIARSLPGASEPVRALLEQRLRAPGGVSLAPIGGGFALPHPSARIALGRDSGAVAVVLLRDPVDPGAARVDDVPVTRLVFFVAPSPRAHLDLIGRIARLIARGGLRDAIARGAGDDEVLAAIEASDAAPPAARAREAGR